MKYENSGTFERLHKERQELLNRRSEIVSGDNYLELRIEIGHEDRHVELDQDLALMVIDRMLATNAAELQKIGVEVS